MAIWNLILAGGAGQRLASLTGGTPKQFWRPDGLPSLLDRTLSRMAPLAPLTHTVTVVGHAHRQYVDAHPAPCRLGQVLVQPDDRGTAAGVLFGLTPLLGEDPESIVVMTPSDHGVRCEELFRAGIRDAIAEIRRATADIVLFGVQPDRAADDYGWITPRGGRGRGSLTRVREFVEKPPSDVAHRLLLDGAVWNTMVVVARTASLWRLYRRHLPQLHAAFGCLAADPATSRSDVVERIYAAIPTRDFSRDVVAPARNLSLMVWPETMGWSDLGTPERLSSWWAHSGRQPSPKEAA